MCWCTPEIRKPYCGKPGCEWPEQKSDIKPRKTIIDLLYETQVSLLKGDQNLALTKVNCILDLITKGYGLEDNLEKLSKENETDIDNLPTVDEEEG